MRSRFLMATLFLAATAQGEEVATNWSHQLAGGVNLNQVALKDWSGGGEDALSWTLTLEGKSGLAKEGYDWSNSYKFAFG